MTTCRAASVATRATFHSDRQPLLTDDNRDFLKDAFVHVGSPDRLGDAIAQALHPTAAMRAAAEEQRDYYFYGLDGRASQRMKDKIESLLAR